MIRALVGAWLLLGSVLAWADSGPRIAIIIDDVGNNYQAARQVLALPIGVTPSILPRLVDSARIAREAHQQGREVMLHQPMEALDHARQGPGGLTLQDSRQQMQQILAANLASVPFAAGVNNHMGSLLTANGERMGWFMQALRRHGKLYFVDSRTDPATQAEATAQQDGLPTSRRNVFLDNVQNAAAIRRQLQRLLRLARRQGSAIGIGHPHPVTLAVLRQVLPEWQKEGVQLLPVSRLIAYQRSSESWPASSSRSLTVAKNSKPSPSSICCVVPASK